MNANSITSQPRAVGLLGFYAYLFPDDLSGPEEDDDMEDEYNECVICGKKEFTAGEPIKKYVCDECSEAHRDEVARAVAE